jgi:hypothetical protein
MTPFNGCIDISGWGVLKTNSYSKFKGTCDSIGNVIVSY